MSERGPELPEKPKERIQLKPGLGQVIGVAGGLPAPAPPVEPEPVGPEAARPEGPPPDLERRLRAPGLLLAPCSASSPR